MDIFWSFQLSQREIRRLREKELKITAELAISNRELQRYRMAMLEISPEENV